MGKKPSVSYVCNKCGKKAPAMLGRCPNCGEYGAFVEEVVTADIPASPRHPTYNETGKPPSKLGDVTSANYHRIQIRNQEFARVLGGGIVQDSVTLISGDPGIGKSTLLLQVALEIAETDSVFYVSGEETEEQIKSRADRVLEGKDPGSFYILNEKNIDVALRYAEQLSPKILIVDSIQTVFSPDFDSSPGSVVQVKECVNRIISYAKSRKVATFVCGHVIKDGEVAGPKTLEHMVDTVLYLEGDHFHVYRMLRTIKNRFGATNEVGVFEMQAGGMIEVRNPSAAFLANRTAGAPGSAIAISMEGTRPLLVETQSLTAPMPFGNPRRIASGIDRNRLQIIVAVLTRRAGLKLGEQDVYVNVVGGMRLDEPAVDLPVAIATASSFYDIPLPADMAFVGEVGLSGELRLCHMIPDRIKEAAKLGFASVVVPAGVKLGSFNPGGTKILQAATLMDVLHIALPAAGKGTARKSSGGNGHQAVGGIPVDQMIADEEAVLENNN